MVSAAPSVTLSANPELVHKGESSTLTWTVSGAVSCTATDTYERGSSGPWPATSGSQVITPRQTASYTLECVDGGGVSSGKKSVTVVYGPRITSLSAKPSPAVRGKDVTFSWTSDADTCLFLDGTGTYLGANDSKVRKATYSGDWFLNCYYRNDGSLYPYFGYDGSNQAKVYLPVTDGVCVPDTSCAANTCQGQTCSDGCGGAITGTKVCETGGGGCIPSSCYYLSGTDLL